MTAIREHLFPIDEHSWPLKVLTKKITMNTFNIRISLRAELDNK